jgi:mRNA interferase RelE/StbE
VAVYNIFFRRSAQRELELLPKRDLGRIVERIANLAIDPRPAGCEKLAGQDRYRIRQGNYRIIYSFQDTELTVWVVKVGHRRDDYQKL